MFVYAAMVVRVFKIFNSRTTARSGVIKTVLLMDAGALLPLAEMIRMGVSVPSSGPADA